MENGVEGEQCVEREWAITRVLKPMSNAPTALTLTLCEFMKRVPCNDLDYPGHDGLYYHEGEPFTGWAIDHDPHFPGESEFRNGMVWGVSRSWYVSGAPRSETYSVAGVFHGLCQEWDEHGHSTLFEVYELGVCIWRRRWDAGQLVEDWRLSDTDHNFGTLQILRDNFMGGLVELGTPYVERRGGTGERV